MTGSGRKLADLAVLTSDYLTVLVQDIGKIRSVLTMVGGRIVFADEPFAGLDAQQGGVHR